MRSADSRLPTFRRGIKPAWFGFRRRFYHQRIDTSHAEQSWIRLCEHPRDLIEYSRAIQKVLGVSTQRSTLYRRLWDVLGLIDDIPGEWNNKSRAEILSEYINSADLDPNAERADHWIDLDALNSPALISRKSRDPSAFSEAVNGYKVYVANRSRESLPSSLLQDNAPVIAYGDGGLLSDFWFNQGGEILIREDNSYGMDIYKLLSFESEKVFNTSVVVMSETESPIAWVTTSEASRAARCLAGERTIPEVRRLLGDKSQATAYRYVKEAEKRGDAIKIRPGVWKFR